jgi:hypothetical protein
MHTGKQPSQGKACGRQWVECWAPYLMEVEPGPVIERHEERRRGVEATYYVTEAPSGRLRALGDHAPFMPIEEAVRDFVTHHLSPPDQ